MKKGHRRTNSQTLASTKPFISHLQNIVQKQQNPFQFSYHAQKQITDFNSIQSLLQKSETNIAKRILYIQNLQQPNAHSNSKNQFSFGKGLNYKLSSFKLNMGQIPQVPKSNQSTSLQGENKLQMLQKQHFLAHETYQNSTPRIVRHEKQLSRPIKFQPKHTKTSSAVGMKKISRFQKSQKTQSKQQIKSVAEINHKDNNPLKRHKLEYQIQKKSNNIGKQFMQMNNLVGRLPKQTYMDHLLVNDHKRKKKTNYL